MCHNSSQCRRKQALNHTHNLDNKIKVESHADRKQSDELSNSPPGVTAARLVFAEGASDTWSVVVALGSTVPALTESGVKVSLAVPGLVESTASVTSATGEGVAELEAPRFVWLAIAVDAMPDSVAAFIKLPYNTMNTRSQLISKSHADAMAMLTHNRPIITITCNNFSSVTCYKP